MKYRFINTLIVVFLLFFNSCFQLNESDEYNEKWISTSSYFWSTSGEYLDLSRKDTLYKTRDFDFDHLKSYKYHIDSLSNLFLEDSIFYGKIIKKTDNILLIEDSFQVSTFIPIKNYNLETDTAEIKSILTANDWQLVDEYNNLRLEFTENPWFINPSQLSFYFRINELKGWESYNGEWWTISKYKNSYFIVLSHRNLDYQFYQIKSISDSIIIAETCWTDTLTEAVFSIKEPLSKKQYNNLRCKVIGSWRLQRFEELVDSSKREDIIPIVRKSKGRFRPFDERDSVPMILHNYYKNKSIKYEFLSDGNCCMKSDDNILRSGKWKLSKDGKYIKIEDGWMRSMRIDSISDGALIIEKHETIEFLDRNYWEDKYIQELLKK